jgi:drug/metabolite transporter (DMT)-like permease
MGMVIALSLGAALCYAVASVLQQRAAASEPLKHSMRATLLLRLLRRPLWLAGRVVDTGGYGLQAAALHAGSLVVVQPLLCVGLLFALPLGMIGTEARMDRREWLGAGTLTAGLAGFVVLSSRAHGRSVAPASRWLLAVVAVGVLTTVLVGFARDRPAAPRAALLGAAAGCLFSLTAALTKAALAHWPQGLLHLLTRWEVYALIVVALIGAVTVQSAFQAGPLAASLPGVTAVEPLVSGLLGVAVFHEQLVRSPLFAAPLVLALAAIGYGIFTLGRSPLIAPNHDSLAAGSS